APFGVTTTATSEDADDAMEGRILRQRPAAGQPLAPGSTVELVVGKKRGPTSTVPDVTSLARDEAERAIGEAKLVADVTEEDGPGNLAGRVLRQNPSGGARVPEG